MQMLRLGRNTYSVVCFYNGIVEIYVDFSSA